MIGFVHDTYGMPFAKRECRNLSNALTLRELEQIIQRHPSAFTAAAERPTITTNDIAFALSQMAVDDDVARDVVATSSGRPIDEVSSGLMTLIRAAAIVRETLSTHLHRSVAKIFVSAAVPGFGSEMGAVQ